MKAKLAAIYPAILGKVIAHLRHSCGMQQNELAAKVKINQSTLSRIEQGTSAVSIDQLARMAIALGEFPSNLVWYADEVTEQAQKIGVKVLYNRTPGAISDGVVLISGDALSDLASRVTAK